MNWWYKLRCRVWHKYNVVVCRSIPPTWIDRDFLLLYAAFQILEDFVQKERGNFYEDVYALYVEDCGPEMAREREAEWNTIRELYAWWNQRKHCFDDDYAEDNMRLHQLIDIRGHLWTPLDTFGPEDETSTYSNNLRQVAVSAVPSHAWR
jgi:hypothetical protein